MAQFYLTLPSNSSSTYYPENTLTHFKTRLHNEISLTGEWEVGLSEIMFPRSWYTINKDRAHFTVSCSNCTLDEPGIPARFTSNISFDEQFHIPSGYYTTVGQIVKEMNEMLVEQFRNPMSEPRESDAARPNFRYNKLKKKTSVTLERNMTVQFSDQLADILGFDSSQNPSTNDTHSEQITVRSSRVSDINGGLYAIFIYCDLMEYIPVGDTLAPLLRIVDVDGNQGEILHRRFDKPRYLPLQKKNFDTIELLIKDDIGKPIPFESGKVVVILHFRQAKDSYFLG